MRDPGRVDGPDLLEPDLRLTQVLEEASTASEQQGSDAEFEFVEESRREVLLDGLGAAMKPDVLIARGLLGPLSAGPIPSVTKWNVVPPSMSSGSRG